MNRRLEEPVRTATELGRIVTWLGGVCGSAAAAGGFFVGFAYALDQSDPAVAPVSGVVGLLVGALLGLLNAVAPVVVLMAVNDRRWAAATPLRAVLAGLAAAAPVGAVNLVSGASPAWLMLCAAVTAVPAAVATLCLDWRTRAKARRALVPTTAQQGVAQDGRFTATSPRP